MYEQTYLKMKVPENQMPEYRKFYEENAEWLTYLTNHTGMVSVCFAIACRAMIENGIIYFIYHHNRT